MRAFASRRSSSELLALAALCMALGMVYAFGYMWRDRIPAGTWEQRLALGQLTSWLWGASIPLIALIDRLIGRRSLAAGIGAHVGTGIALTMVIFAARWLFATRELNATTLPPVPYVVMWMDVAAITYLILLGVVRVRRAYVRHAHRAEVALRLETDVANTRLEFLRRQLEPHFLFNSLNCVAELAHESTETAVSTVRQLRRLLRSVVADTAGAEVALRRELHSIDAYLAIQQARFRDRLVVTRSVDESVLDALVPRFVLQPIVENAIKYGLGDSRRPGRVTIAASGDATRIRLVVTNTRSRALARQANGTTERVGHGIGLANVRDRLTELYGSGFALRLDTNDDGGTSVTVELARRIARAAAERRNSSLTPIGRGGLEARDESESIPEEAAEELAPLPRPAGRLALQVLAMTGFLFLMLAVSALAVERFSFASPARLWMRWSYQLVGLSVGVALAPLLVLLVRRIPAVFHSARARLVATYAGTPILYSAAYAVAVIPLQLRVGAVITPGFFLRQVILGITFPLVMVVLVHHNDLIRWYHEKVSAELKLRAALASERWRLRRMRVDPGFLLGTLEWVERRLVAGDVRGAEQIIRRFAAMLRLVVASASDDEVTLERELALVRAYTDVWRETIDCDIDLWIDVPPELLERHVPNRVFASELEPVADERGDASAITVRIDARQLDGATEVRLSVNASGSARGPFDRSATWTLADPNTLPMHTTRMPPALPSSAPVKAVASFGVVLAATLALTCPAATAGAQAARGGAGATSVTISADDLRARLFAFAHDSMLGRQFGTAGNAKATDYIAREFARFGLRPGGDDGTFFQTLPYRLIQVDTASHLEVGGQRFRGDDFIRIDARAAARPLASTPSVYGGIASDTSTWITAEQARGRVVVFGLAAAQRERRAFFQYHALARHPRFAGAAALAFPQLEFIPPFALDNVRRGFPVLAADEDSTLVPQIQISARLAEALIPALADASAGAAGTSVSGGARLLRTAMPHPTRNVVGIIQGSDPALRGQYMLLSAHNDHVGRTPNPIDHDSLVAFNTVVRPGGAEDSGKQASESDWPRIRAILDSLRRVNPPRTDSVFNGADDDGSGTVAILEIAEAMAAAPTKPRRSIIFVSHTAEEVGLVGSRWFTDHPPVPLDSIVAMIDQDMVGRGTAADLPEGGPAYLQMIGSRRLSREFGDLIEKANATQRAPFTIDYSYDAPGHPLQYYCRADHYSYARYGIPSASVSRGGHRDYHELSDEPQYISYPDLARVAQLVHDAALLVANAPTRPALDGPRPNPAAPCRQ